MSDPTFVNVPWPLLQRLYTLLDLTQPNRPETEELFEFMTNALDAHDKEVRHGHLD